MPDFKIENEFTGLIAGVDEAGRGPWAGPVVAGAVIVKNHNLPQELLNNLDDSKKLTPQKREKLYALLEEQEKLGNVVIGIGQASAQEIDEYNILQATFMAMKRATDKLAVQPDFAIVDGNQTPKNFTCPVKTVVKGDAKSISIAAASIMAKVYRDHLMQNLAKKYPFYAFEKNAGYGTKAHIEGIAKYGVTPEHRKSYRPVAEFLQKTA